MRAAAVERRVAQVKVPEVSCDLPLAVEMTNGAGEVVCKVCESALGDFWMPLPFERRWLRWRRQTRAEKAVGIGAGDRHVEGAGREEGLRLSLPSRPLVSLVSF